MIHTQSIIDVLRDDNEYYKGVGRNYLSNSDIGSLLTNPKNYGVMREDNKNFAEGRYFHQLLLEPQKAVNVHHVDVSTRTTKEYKSYCSEKNIEFCMLTKEKEEIESLVSVMKGNIQFFEQIYKDGNLYETPSVIEIEGLMWKGKADIVTDECVIDLKTTSDINKFKYSAKSYNYDSQCFIYQLLFGKPLVFYVIDKLTSQLGIFRPSENFVAGGEAKVIKACEVYRRYFIPGHTDDISNHYIDDVL
jgi:hypothetical protein